MALVLAFAVPNASSPIVATAPPAANATAIATLIFTPTGRSLSQAPGPRDDPTSSDSEVTTTNAPFPTISAGGGALRGRSAVPAATAQTVATPPIGRRRRRLSMRVVRDGCRRDAVAGGNAEKLRGV